MRVAPGRFFRVARPSSSANLRGTVGRLLSSCLPSAVGSRKASSTSESHTAAHPHARNFQRLCLGTGRSYKLGRRSGRKFVSAMQTSFFLSSWLLLPLTRPSTGLACQSGYLMRYTTMFSFLVNCLCQITSLDCYPITTNLPTIITSE